jgi:hypothetical protein
VPSWALAFQQLEAQSPISITAPNNKYLIFIIIKK